MLVDIIQKSVILSATLYDLYSSNVASIGQNRADISIQPFATNSILQHHYKSNANPLSTTALDQSQIATKQASSPSPSPSSSTSQTNQPLNTDTNTTTDNTSGVGGDAKLCDADRGSLGNINININNAVLPLHKVNASATENTIQVSFSKLFLFLLQLSSVLFAPKCELNFL